MADFGDNLRVAREKATYTQQELADAVHITQTAVAKYETNALAPNVHIAHKMAKALNTTLNDLMAE